MDKEGDNLKLFEFDKEYKVLTNEEAINNMDKKTGQLAFLTPEHKIRTILKEEMQPLIDSNKDLSEKSARISNTLERAIPHLQNKMIGDDLSSTFNCNTLSKKIYKIKKERIRCCKWESVII